MEKRSSIFIWECTKLAWNYWEKEERDSKFLTWQLWGFVTTWPDWIMIWERGFSYHLREYISQSKLEIVMKHKCGQLEVLIYCIVCGWELWIHFRKLTFGTIVLIGGRNIRQQWGVVRHGTPPLKTEKSNNPPPKKSGGGGRYPPPTGSEKLGPPWRAERAENFFLFFYVVKKFLTTFFFL